MKQTLLLGLLLFMALALSGCQSLGPLGKVSLPWSGAGKMVESKYQAPARMVAIWSHATYNSAGQKSVRGFGGRIYFYNDKQQPVPVEGQLVVYAYDDTQLGVPADSPSRKYVFTAQQLTEHFGETDLGASYSIWLPWDEIGGKQMSISLLPILTTSSGQVVTGTPSLSLLPGTKPDALQQEYFTGVEPESAGARRSLSKLQSPTDRFPAARDAGNIAAVEYRQPIDPQPPSQQPTAQQPPAQQPAAQQPQRMQTTTIKPTARLAEQLMAQRSERIAQQYRQRNRLTEPETGAPMQFPNHATESQPQQVQASRFSRRPGEAYRSRIYSGQSANP